MNGSDISSAVIALQNFEMIIALIKDGPEIMEKSLVGMLDWRGDWTSAVCSASGAGQSSPVVVGIINPQDDLSDGGEAPLVLSRDVDDVRGQGLHLPTDDDVAAARVHREPLLGWFSGPRLLKYSLLAQQAVEQLGVSVVVEILCRIILVDEKNSDLSIEDCTCKNPGYSGARRNCFRHIKNWSSNPAANPDLVGRHRDQAAVQDLELDELGLVVVPVRHVDHQLTFSDVSGGICRLQTQIVDLLLLSVKSVRSKVDISIGRIQLELVTVLPVQLQFDTISITDVGV